MAGIGFGIQHDANHGAYSSRAAVNRVMAMTLDMLGASSYLWRVKHNLSHHTYTNIDGRRRRHQLRPLRAAVAGAAALSPAPPAAVLLVGAVLVPVPQVELRRRLQDRDAGANLRARRSRDRAARAWSSSSAARSLFFALGVRASRCCSTRGGSCSCSTRATSLVLGTTLAVVFMLAHCVEEADFPGAVRGRRGCHARGRCIRSRPRSTSRAATGC